MSYERDEKFFADKKRDETRRVEIAMLGLLIEKYPRESRQKVSGMSERQPVNHSDRQRETSLER